MSEHMTTNRERAGRMAKVLNIPETEHLTIDYIQDRLDEAERRGAEEARRESQTIMEPEDFEKWMKEIGAPTKIPQAMRDAYEHYKRIVMPHTAPPDAKTAPGRCYTPQEP